MPRLFTKHNKGVAKQMKHKQPNKKLFLKINICLINRFSELTKHKCKKTASLSNNVLFVSFDAIVLWICTCLLEKLAWSSWTACVHIIQKQWNMHVPYSWMTLIKIENTLKAKINCEIETKTLKCILAMKSYSRTIEYCWIKVKRLYDNSVLLT